MFDEKRIKEKVHVYTEASESLRCITKNTVYSRNNFINKTNIHLCMHDSELYMRINKTRTLNNKLCSQSQGSRARMAPT